MRYAGVHIHGAHADTLACVVLVRFLEEPAVAVRLSSTLRGLASSPDPANRLAAEQVESALAEMRDARAVLARHRDELRGSSSGTSEPVEVEGGGGSAVSPQTGRVAEVAERLELSESYVKRLCRDGILSATKSGRDWLIDEASVVEIEAARRPVA